MTFLITVSLMMTAILFPWGDHYVGGWYVAQLFLSVFAGFSVRSRYGLLAGTTVGYTLLNGVAIFADRFAFAHLGGSKAMAISAVTAQSTFAFLLIVVVLMGLRKRHFENIDWALGQLCFLNALYTIYCIWVDSPYGHGFLGNQSINGVLTAVTYPFLAGERTVRNYAFRARQTWRDRIEFARDLAHLMVPPLSILVAGSSIPIATLAVIVFASMFYAFSKRFILVVFIVGSLSAWELAIVRPDLLHDQGRFYIWGIAWEWFKMNAGEWAGMGPGTVFLWLPRIQEIHNIAESNWWIWMHNDWFQTLFELGRVGLGLYVTLYLWSLLKLIRNPPLFLSLLGMGFSCFFDFNIHIPVIGFIAAYLIARANYRWITYARDS